MNHKQAEIVVARVLSDKMRVKNKSLAAEYKKLKVCFPPLFLSGIELLYTCIFFMTTPFSTTALLGLNNEFGYIMQIDHAAKKRRLRLLEDQLRKLTEYRRSSVTGTESEDFDEVFQFQALLAQAQACDELLRKN